MKEIDKIEVDKKVDLHWKDDHVFPDVTYPDLDFLLKQMTEKLLMPPIVPGPVS